MKIWMKWPNRLNKIEPSDEFIFEKYAYTSHIGFYQILELGDDEVV